MKWFFTPQSLWWQACVITCFFSSIVWNMALILMRRQSVLEKNYCWCAPISNLLKLYWTACLEFIDVTSHIMAHGHGLLKKSMTWHNGHYFKPNDILIKMIEYGRIWIHRDGSDSIESRISAFHALLMHLYMIKRKQDLKNGYSGSIVAWLIGSQI